LGRKISQIDQNRPIWRTVGGDMDVIALIGRILFVVIFVSSGTVGHIGQRKGMAQYASSQGVPAAESLVVLSGLLIAVGGLMVGLGIWGDLGALLLLLFVVPAAFWIHAYWKVDDPMQRADQQAHFMKNLALAGGCIMAFVLFAGLGHDLGLTITGPLFNLR
jgi:putative oxidoreductase